MIKKGYSYKLLKMHHITNALTYPFKHFVQTNSLGGIILLFALLFGWSWANSPWQSQYHALWEQTYVGMFWDQYYFKMTLQHWVNDGLMAIFFFMVGLEIKREFLVGELSVPRKALFPVAAAMGGMIAPAIIYIAFQNNEVALRGWAIPTATDIAFALGILSLLGKRAPISLKIFLTALAIVDDIGAILLIGIFYSAPPNWIALGIGGIILFFMFYISRLGIRALAIYLFLAIMLWCAFLASGVHATLAGVLAAFAIPVKVKINRQNSAEKSSMLADKLQHLSGSSQDVLADKKYHSVLSQMSNLYKDAGVPLRRLEHQLHPIVSYGVLPIFALANGGVTLEPGLSKSLFEPLSLGIVAGLCLGKPLGIVSVCWGLKRLGVVELPDNMNWRQILAGGFFAGIGFTMSIFIAGLAFDDIQLLNQAKLAILVASILSTVMGIALLTWQEPRSAAR